MPEGIDVRLIGGPYDGHTVHVPAVEMYETGELVPEPSMYRTPDPRLADVFGLRTMAGSENVLGEQAYRLLTYERQHRGGEWVYVLFGLGEDGLPDRTDPVLETLIRHIREQWSNRQYFEASQPVAFDQRIAGGKPLEDHLAGALTHQLHKQAAEKDLMILAVDGPAWRRERNHYLDEVLELRAVGLPRFHREG